MTTDLAAFGLGDLAGMASAMTSASQEATAGGSFNGKDLLKLSQDDGSWLAGQDGYSVNGNVVINPASFRRGHVAWENYQIVGEVMGSVADPVTPIHELPPVQSKSGWQEQWSFEAAEPETGAQLMFKSSSMGGVEAVKALIGAVGSQLVTDPEHPVAEVMLRHTSYISKAKKKVFKPTFNLAAWHTPDSMNLLDSPSQPEPQPETRPAPTPPADRQRQRRSAV